MNRVVLQVPLSPSLRKNAEKQAQVQGFSSLQDAVRMYLHKLASKAIQVRFQEQIPVRLSPAAAKRYDKMDEDYKKGENIFVAENVNDLMDQLNGTKSPVPYKVSKELQRKSFTKSLVSSRI